MPTALEIQQAGGLDKWMAGEARRASLAAGIGARLHLGPSSAARDASESQAQGRGDFEALALSLPWPPSVNHYWRRVEGKTLVSAEGRRYRDQVKAVVLAMRAGAEATCRLAVVIEASPPDRRKRDLDNLPKAVLDALTHAGVWGDDSQIDDLRIVRRPVVAGGRLIVQIRRIGQ